MTMSEKTGENVEKAVGMVERAADRGARIVCLPELFATRYFCQSHNDSNFDLAIGRDDPLLKRFMKLAERRKVALVVPFFERSGPGLYFNSSMVINSDGTEAGLYRKTHIPDDPSFHEKYYFAPGDLGFKAFDLGFIKVGVLICWDQWFPEAARLTAMMGADIIFYPSAIGLLPDERGSEGEKMRQAWITVQRGNAIANGLFVAAVNRVGCEGNADGGGIDFFGSSFIAGPLGEIIDSASETEEQVIVAKIDLSLIEKTRRTWPFFRDRRIDLYGGITSR